MLNLVKKQKRKFKAQYTGALTLEQVTLLLNHKSNPNMHCCSSVSKSNIYIDIHIFTEELFC